MLKFFLGGDVMLGRGIDQIFKWGDSPHSPPFFLL